MGLGPFFRIGPDQGAACGACDRQAEEGATAVGAPPVPEGLRGTLATDDNVASVCARRREPGEIRK
ncbi:hypothetical protein GCM10010273_43020 [Streptomyces lavendulocolor]